MKFLLCGVFSYYGKPGTHDPMYFYFNDTLTEMGFQIESIDTFKYGFNEEGRDGFNEYVLEKIKKDNYNAMIVATYGYEFYPEILDELRKYTKVIAWNSDDDNRWEDYSKKFAPYYDLMYTTYKNIYDKNKFNYPSLRLSQWACLEKFDGKNRNKIIPFSFVGQPHGDRLKILYYLKKKTGLQSWGRGTYQVTSSYYIDKALRGASLCFCKLTGKSLIPDHFISFEEANRIWSSSKISLNLMRSSRGDKLQIKGRTFDMGLSGTVMICEHAPNLELYYEPNKEFLTFVSLKDLVDKVKYYLKHENQLKKIAEAYYQRTKKEHLWRHRIENILKDAEIKK